MNHAPTVEIPDPQAEETFQSRGSTWQWPDGSPQAGMRRLYAALLAARRNWPALADRTAYGGEMPFGKMDLRVRLSEPDGLGGPSYGMLVVERGNEGDRIVAVANCTDRSCDDAQGRITVPYCF